MALSFVGGKTATFAGTGGTTNISLTNLTGGSDSSPSANDIVIIAYSVAANSDQAIGVTTAGYAEEQELWSPDSRGSNLSVSWKIMGATPDTSVTVSSTGALANAGAVAIHVWRGVDTGTPFDVAEATAIGGNTDRANPPAITPTSSGAIVIACGAGAADTGAVYTSSDLANFFTATSADNFDAEIGMGSIAWSGSGAVDPATFGGGENAATGAWCAVTLALRPSGGAGDQTLSAPLHTNPQTFHVPTASASNALVALLLADADVFPSPAVWASNMLAPGLFTSGQTFYSPTAGNAGSIGPPLIAAGPTFLGPVASSSLILSAPLLPEAGTIFGPDITAPAVLAAPLLSAIQSFFPHVLASYTFGPSVRVHSVKPQIRTYRIRSTRPRAWLAPGFGPRIHVAPALKRSRGI